MPRSRTQDPSRKPTIKDIAERARVSVSAVSKVLNRYPDFSIGDEARGRIHAAVAELGYEPDATARSMRRRKTDTLGLILHSFHGFGTELLSALESEVRSHGKGIEVAVTGFDLDREVKLLHHFANRMCDGVLVVSCWEPGPLSAEAYRRQIPPALPVAFVDSHVPFPGAAAAVGDNGGDMERAVDRWVATGRRGFTYFESGMRMPVLTERREGFLRAMKRHRIPAASAPVMTLAAAPGHGVDFLGDQFARAPLGHCFVFESLAPFPGWTRAFASCGRHFGEDLVVGGFDAPVVTETLGSPEHPGPRFTRPVPYVEQDARGMVRAALRALEDPEHGGDTIRVPGSLRHFDGPKSR